MKFFLWPRESKNQTAEKPSNFKDLVAKTSKKNRRFVTPHFASRNFVAEANKAQAIHSAAMLLMNEEKHAMCEAPGTSSSTMIKAGMPALPVIPPSALVGDLLRDLSAFEVGPQSRNGEINRRQGTQAIERSTELGWSRYHRDDLRFAAGTSAPSLSFAQPISPHSSTHSARVPSALHFTTAPI